MSHQEAINYVPPAGINLNFLEWFPSKNQVVIEFLCTDLEPDPILRKSLKDIHHELGTTFRGKVLQRNLGSHAKSPKKGMMLEINLANPLIAEAPSEIKRAAEEATDVHDIFHSKEEAEEDAVVESSYRFTQNGMPGIGNSGMGERGHYTRKLRMEPEEVVQERFYRQVGGPEQALQEEYGPEMYRYKMGVIDIG